MCELIGKGQNCGGHYFSPLIYPYSVASDYKYLDLFKNGNNVTFNVGNGVWDNVKKSFWDRNLSIYQILDIASLIRTENHCSNKIINGKDVFQNTIYFGSLNRYLSLPIELQKLIVRCIIRSDGELESLFPELEEN